MSDIFAGLRCRCWHECASRAFRAAVHCELHKLPARSLLAKDCHSQREAQAGLRLQIIDLAPNETDQSSLESQLSLWGQAGLGLQSKSL